MPVAKIKINGVWYTLSGAGSSSSVSQEDLDQAVQDAKDYAKSYADSINGPLSQDMTNMQDYLDNLGNTIDEAFKDSIVYEAEERNIRAYLNTLATGKATVDGRYVQIYNDPLLVDNLGATPPETAKADLYTAKNNFDIKYDDLVNTINTVIADTRVDDTERTEVDNAFTEYSNSISALSSALEKAISFIAQRKADVAQSNASQYADGLFGDLSETVESVQSTISQTAEQISLKVSKQDYDNEKAITNWYNFVKSGSLNLVGDLESEELPSGYSWVLTDLPDGSQGRALYKKHTGGDGIRNNNEWVMPKIKVDPTKPYLMEFWVLAKDTNSEVYFGREEYKELTDGTFADNDQGNGPYMVAAVTATTNIIGTWVKHYAVIPPHDAGLENDHYCQQSSFTPDQDYKFYNIDSTYISPKVLLTFGVVNTNITSEMYAWGFGLYDIGTKVNAYEELSKSLNMLETRVTSAEQKIEDDAIISTVTSSVTFANYLDSKADTSDLSGLITQEQLQEMADAMGVSLEEALEALKLEETYVTKSELEQTSNDITARFSASGGLNILKNSIGYVDFTPSSSDGWMLRGYTSRILRISDLSLDTLGFGSGFEFIPAESDSYVYMEQTVPVVADKPYTLSWYVNKLNSSSPDNSDGALRIQILEDSVLKKEYVYNSDAITHGYENGNMLYSATSSSVTIRIYAGGLVNGTVTGLMLNFGDIVIPWCLATGESFNTNVKMDLNGIRVSQIETLPDGTKKEVGFTRVTPDEFAGYYDSDGDGTFEKVFYLNGDETVSKRVRAKNEITLGYIKIVRIESEASTGWAFVPSGIEEDEVISSDNIYNVNGDIDGGTF